MQFSNDTTRQFFANMLSQAGGDMRIVEAAIDQAVRAKRGRPVSEEDVSQLISVALTENRRRA